MSIQAAQINLNGGEISPLLHYRADLDKHSSGLAQCKNFIPLPFGGVRKRPGTKFLAELPNASENDVMRSFRGTDGKRYVLIFTPTKFYAWDIAGASLHSQSIAWSVTADQLSDLRVIALNDVLFLTSPHHHPLKLSYTNATTWTLEKITFTESPKLDENLLENTKISVLSNPVATTWVSGTTYVIGNNRLNTAGTCEYTCTAGHSANASRQPGVGATWRQYWKVTTYAEGTSVTLKTHIGITNWSGASVSYARLKYVDYNGTPYRCLIAHNSGVSTTPGAETVIGTYWEKCIDVFNSLHVATDSTFNPAANFTVNIRRDDQSNQSTLNAFVSSNGLTSTPILIRGAWSFTTYGTWAGTFTIQRSRNGGIDYETVSTHQSTKDRNISIAGDESEAVWMQLLFTSEAMTTTSGDPPRGVLEPALAYVSARFDIVTYTSSRSVTATSRGISFSGTTDRWLENAFNKTQGYPRAIALHERRLYFAGTTNQPLGIWASVIEDFLNFTSGTQDDASIFVVLAASAQNPILWLSSQRRLFIGTEFSEWVIGSEINDNPITPTNFLAREYTTYGSANQEPINIGDAVVFAQRNGQRVREMAYQSERETYDSADLTRLAEHIFQEGDAPCIKKMAWQQIKEPILWCVLDNGTLATFSYIRNERINAWATHHTGEVSFATFKSVTVSPTDSTSDTIYFVVKRNDVYLLESIEGESDPLTDANAANFVVFDCQRTISRTLGQNCVNATDYLLSCCSIPVDCFDTGYDVSPDILYGIESPAMPCPVAGNYFYGELIEGRVISLPVEAPTQTGSSIGRKKRIHKLRCHLRPGFQLKCRINPQEDILTAIDFVTMAPSYDTLFRNVTDVTTYRLLYSGWVEQNVNITGPIVWAHLRHLHPSPITITALVAEMEVYQ